jgi:hypothetical protein
VIHCCYSVASEANDVHHQEASGQLIMRSSTAGAIKKDRTIDQRLAAHQAQQQEATGRSASDGWRSGTAAAAATRAAVTQQQHQQQQNLRWQQQGQQKQQKNSSRRNKTNSADATANNNNNSNISKDQSNASSNISSNASNSMLRFGRSGCH